MGLTFSLVACVSLVLLIGAGLMIRSLLGLWSVDPAFIVGRRAGEIAVRMALGAQTGDVLRLILMEGMKPTLIGLVIGLGVALALRQVLASLLYGVGTADPATLAVGSFVLATVAFLASLVPALRATRVEIIQALREE